MASTSADSSGALSVDLRTPSLAWQALTLNQPLLGAAYTAAALGYLGYKTAPWFTKKFARLASPILSKDDKEVLEKPDHLKDPEERADEKKTWAGVLAALGALSVIGLNWRPDWPDKGMFSYSRMGPVTKAPEPAPKPPPPAAPPAAPPPTQTASASPAPGVTKVSSMPDLGGALPLDQCKDLINHNPMLEPYVKGQALALLDSFNAPPTQPINGGNLIGQAIATGQSAATGLAVGWLTAKALGLPNPKSTAILGAVANTLGPWSAVATSLALGR